MFKTRPLTALLCVVILAGAIAGCGSSTPQAAATAAPDQPAVPATAAPAPVATATPAVALTADAPASPTLAATATAGIGAAATVIANAPTLGGASSPVPQASIDAMIADLAKMTGVDPAQVSVISAEAVTWRDGSLGCPQPGMMYPQVLTEGFRVVLAADGKEYAYHGGDQGTFFYCANPSQ